MVSNRRRSFYKNKIRKNENFSILLKTNFFGFNKDSFKVLSNKNSFVSLCNFLIHFNLKLIFINIKSFENQIYNNQENEVYY